MIDLPTAEPFRKRNKDWIGVDLDGTLAVDNGVWEGPDKIGAPIASMVMLVRSLLKDGDDVRIFTARLSSPGYSKRKIKEPIERWCERHIGSVLPITNVKDHHCSCIIDNIAVGCHTNSGRLILSHLAMGRVLN